MDEDCLQSILDWFEQSMKYVHDEIKGNKTVSLESLNGNVLGKLTWKQRDKIQFLYDAAETMRNKVKSIVKENSASPQGPATCHNMTDERKETNKSMVSINDVTIVLKKITANKDVAKWPDNLVYENIPPQYKHCMKDVEQVYNFVKEIVKESRQSESSEANTFQVAPDAKCVVTKRDGEYKEDRSEHELLTYVENLEKCQAQAWPQEVELKCYKPSSNVFVAVDKLYKIARQNGVENNKHKQELQSAKSQISALQKSVASNDTNRKEKHVEQRNITKEIEKRDTTINSLELQLQRCETELQDVRLRLSALMGAKLQQGNPNITDLSDVNRPTKIAEQFSQLYDDEWTDAFNVQIKTMKRSEQQAADKLLDMLKDAFMFCSRTSKVQTVNILKELGLCDVSPKTHTKPTLTIKSLNEIQRKHLNELRRVTASLSTNQLENMFVEHMKNTQTGKYDSGEIQGSISFIEKCVVVCWYMVLQDPPVAIQFEKENIHITPFRGNEYRFYNRSGPMFDFIVWPPLRLMEGGDILMKGVAQPMV